MFTFLIRPLFVHRPEDYEYHNHLDHVLEKLYGIVDTYLYVFIIITSFQNSSVRISVLQKKFSIKLTKNWPVKGLRKS